MKLPIIDQGRRTNLWRVLFVFLLVSRLAARLKKTNLAAYFCTPWRSGPKAGGHREPVRPVGWNDEHRRLCRDGGINSLD